MREFKEQFITPVSARMDSTDAAGHSTKAIKPHEALRKHCAVVFGRKESSR